MQVRKVINSPAQKVWDILTDTRQWPVWGPSVTAVECPQRYISAGSQGRVKIRLGIWLDFEITGFAEQSYWIWKVAGITATGHRLRPLGPDSCKLSFEMPFAAFPYALICRQAANRIARLAEENVSS